jgi:hypothetical protein
MSPEDLNAMEWFQSIHALLMWVSVLAVVFLVVLGLLKEKYEHRSILILFLLAGLIAVLAPLGMDQSQIQVDEIKQRSAREQKESLDKKVDEILEGLGPYAESAGPDTAKMDAAMAGLQKLLEEHKNLNSRVQEFEQQTTGRDLCEDDRKKIRDILKKSGRKKIFITSSFNDWEERHFYNILKETVEAEWEVEKLPASAMTIPVVLGLRIDAGEKPSPDAFETANILYLALKSVESIHIHEKLEYNPELDEGTVVLIVGKKPEPQ